jgi:hypothetical protein
MKHFAWINTETNLVENVIYYDGETPLTLPDNVILVEYSQDGDNVIRGSWSPLGIGWSYINGQFVEPPAPELPEPPQQPTTTGSQTL